MHSQRVTRYNLTIAFEEPYTQDDIQLHASANAIGAATGMIEQLITTDRALQDLLKTQNLTLNIISPVRVPTPRGAGDARGKGPYRSNEQNELHP
jgi:hypothetical protein